MLFAYKTIAYKLHCKKHTYCITRNYNWLINLSYVNDAYNA